jgi:hypothetical protein
MEWRTESSLRPKNVPVQKLRMKWMLILSILDNQGEPKIN